VAVVRGTDATPGAVAASARAAASTAVTAIVIFVMVARVVDEPEGGDLGREGQPTAVGWWWWRSESPVVWAVCSGLWW